MDFFELILTITVCFPLSPRIELCLEALRTRLGCLSGVGRWKPSWWEVFFVFFLTVVSSKWTNWIKTTQCIQYLWKTSRWFQIFVIFAPIWGRFPFWLIFLDGLKPPTRKTRQHYWFYRSFILSARSFPKRQLNLQPSTIKKAIDWSISTWNLFVLCFGGWNPPKEGLFQSKQGSFGFQVYLSIFCLYLQQF